MSSASSSIPTLASSGPEVWEAGLVHRVQMPDGPGPYPTVVMLHGRYGTDEVMWIFRRTIPRPWLVVAPRAPLPDHDGYSWLIQRPDAPWPELFQFESAIASLVKFLGAMPRLYNADPERLYLMGFSQGAATAYAAALSGAAKPAAIAGLVGFTPVAEPEQVAGKLSKLPVFMAVGTEDERVPYDVSSRSAGLLRAAGADLNYHEYATGHKMTADGLRDLQAWWLAR